VCDRPPGRATHARVPGVSVRREPNAPSGGRASGIGVGDFLVRGGHGPEHRELLRPIGTLVERGPSRA
jgi:hypothetical protein